MITNSRPLRGQPVNVQRCLRHYSNDYTPQPGPESGREQLKMTVTSVNKREAREVFISNDSNPTNQLEIRTKVEANLT